MTTIIILILICIVLFSDNTLTYRTRKNKYVLIYNGLIRVFLDSRLHTCNPPLKWFEFTIKERKFKPKIHKKEDFWYVNMRDGSIIEPVEGNLYFNKEWVWKSEFPYFYSEYVTYVYDGKQWIEKNN